MKKLLLTLLTLSSIAFASCKSNVETTKSHTLDYEMVGELHNEGLDFILEEIKSQPTTKNGVREISRQFIDNAIEKFLNNNNINTGYESVITRSASELNESVAELSDSTAKIYYAKIQKVFYSSEFSNSKDAIEHIEAIEEEIKLNCTGSDLSALLCGASVAKNTLIYWEKNTAKWVEAITGANTRVLTRAEWSWKEFGGQDVSGAVAGAVVGAGVGSLAGGAGAVPGAIVGGLTGGVANSAEYAVKQIWDWFWE